MPVLECGVRRVMSRAIGAGRRLCDAEELVDQVWLQCMRRRPKRDPKAYQGCWRNLNGTVRTTMREYSRKPFAAGAHIRSMEAFEDGSIDLPDRHEQGIAAVDTADLIAALRRRLTDRQNTILIGRLRGQSNQAIGKGLGLCGERIRQELLTIRRTYSGLTAEVSV